MMNGFPLQITPMFSKLVVAGCLLAPLPLLAQNPDAAPADLRYSRAAFTHNHLLAQIELRIEENKYVRYQYDRYPDLVRIKMQDGTTYARPKGKAWLKSNDWGETGTPVKTDKINELDADAKIAELPMNEGRSLDRSQGGTVWRLVDRTRKGADEYFTYERSRERPRAGGVYPRYTFVKYKDDTDGKLLLSHYSGQLRADNRIIPIETQFDLMIQLPAGSVKFEKAPVSNGSGSKR